jgi:hypothetical protein
MSTRNKQGDKVMTDDSKKENLIFIVPGIIFVFAAIFFFGDGGAAALKAQGAGFWIGVVVCILIAAVLALLSKYLNDHGDDRKALVAVILAVIIFVAPFGKACTAKQNPTIQKTAK